MPPLVALLAEEAPNISIDINYVDYEVRSSLKKNEVLPIHQERYMDLIIGFFGIAPPQYNMEELYSTEAYCVARSDHPYLQNPTMENYLAAQHLVVSQPFYGTPTKTDELLDKQNQSRNIAMRLADVYQAMMLLPHTNFLATLPKECIDSCNYPNLSYAASPVADTSEPVTMIWDKRQNTDKAHSWLREAIIRACKRYK